MKAKNNSVIQVGLTDKAKREDKAELLTDHFRNLKSCKKIGLFDSGIGGLSVLRKLTNLSYGLAGTLANEKTAERQFVYLGDTARFPYGNRPASEIVAFVMEIIDWLVAQDVDGILIACNTSTALALEAARHVSAVPVFDIIEPTAIYLASLDKKIGILSTASTSTSRAYSKAISALNPEAEIIEIGCPDLVPLVEHGKIFDRTAKTVLKPYVERLLNENVSALVLGCTHFPFLMQPLKELVDDRIAIIDPAEILAIFLRTSNNSSINGVNTDHCSIFVTGNQSQFEQAASLCLGHPLYTAGSVTIDELRTRMLSQDSDKQILTSELSNTKRASSILNPDNLVAAVSAGNT